MRCLPTGEPSAQMGGPVWGRTLSSGAIPGGHVTSLGDLAKRPRHSPDLPVLQLVGTIPAATGGQQDGIVSCGESVQHLQSVKLFE